MARKEADQKNQMDLIQKRNPTKPMGFPKTQPNQKNLKKKKGKRKKKLIKILIWKIQEKLQSLESILQKAGNY